MDEIVSSYVDTVAKENPAMKLDKIIKYLEVAMQYQKLSRTKARRLARSSLVKTRWKSVPRYNGAPRG